MPQGGSPPDPGVGLVRVAYQGEPGAFGEVAVQRHFRRMGQTAEAVGFPSFAATFDAFRRAEAPFAMLPVENSYAGSVHEVYDHLLDTPEAIAVGEIVIPIHHCLLAPPGVGVDEIRRVRSHPQALAQCAPFLEANAITPEPVWDTAGAARQVAEQRPAQTGAIASAAAARRYGLEILVPDIEASKDNRTRFLLLGRKPAPPAERSKTSLVIWLEHVPGSLATCLGVLAREGLNLTKIESRPSRTGPWEYVFYLDFEGHPDTPAGRAALRGLEAHTEGFRLLGAYPASPGPVEDIDP